MVNVAVVGMGYVGIPVALTLAKSGLEVIGLDIDQEKVDSLNNSQYPLKGEEPGIQNLLEEVIDKQLFHASVDFSDAENADAWLVCVQTPFLVDEFRPNFKALKGAVSEISKNLSPNSVVVIESTIPPGTTESVVIPLLESHSSLVAGEDFGVGHCPERVMPGKLINNLTTYNRVLGGIDDNTHSVMIDIYSRITNGDLYCTDIKTAEVVKTFENTYRDVEIAIANDFARYCDSVGVDFFEVRDQVNTVEARNLHLPGGGVGGHCIPKDTWLLAYGSKDNYDPNFLTMARKVNDSMPNHISEKCISIVNKFNLNPSESVVTILGLSYLEESDDVRNSPSATLYNILTKQFREVRVHDHYADDYPGIENQKNIEVAVKDSDLIVIMVGHQLYRSLDLRKIGNLMRNKLLVDSRNSFSKTYLEDEGFAFDILGRGRSW
ncbi:MAG: hypothetical protein CMB08_03640 [Euryarchaeota archaeon]|nr:hypothetical protein [Euryarchaeota archaeon]